MPQRALVLSFGILSLAVGDLEGTDLDPAETKPPEGDIASLVNMSLEQLSALKVETVFGASKHEQKTTEAPSSVTIVARDDITRQGHRTLRDVLNSVAGLYVSYDRGYANIGVRGFNRPGDYGGRILLMVDGHRLNEAIYDSAASDTDFPVDVDLIERVEVIRGPGSSLYGNNAFFGVINVVTRGGRDVDGTELSSSFGSFDTWTGRLTYGKRFANDLEVLVSGSWYDSQGNERLAFPEFVAEHLDGGSSRQAFVKASYQDLSLQGGFGRRHKDWPNAAYDSVPNSHDPNLWSVDERAWADLTFAHEFDGDWQFSTRAYFDRYYFDSNYPYDYDTDPTTRPSINQDRASTTAAGLEMSVSKSFRDRHLVTLGGEWRHDFERTQLNWDVAPYVLTLNSRSSGDIVGAFLQDEWQLRPDLILNAGVRYDYYSTFGDTLNPRAALIYNPWAATTFKAIYGQAFRAPNEYEINYAGVISVPNPDLQPEATRTSEIVWEQRVGQRWRSRVAAFWTDVEHLIELGNVDVDRDPATLDDDLYQFRNLGAAVARGAEIEIEGRLPGGIRTLASYTFTDSENPDTDQRLENSPRHLGKFAVQVPCWREKVFASLELQAMSSRRTVAGAEIDPFAIVNLTLFSRELIKGLEFSGSIYNLLDQRYSHPVPDDFTYIGPISGNTIALDTIEQDGRSFRVKLTYHF
ncbi:MAG: TonB-dependent receptor [Verrucomicrobiales bacterium]|nr:TonB-dependent receptor [Verrucomicrobiales bacterium]